MKLSRTSCCFLFLAAALAALCVFSLSFGPSDFSLGDIFSLLCGNARDASHSVIFFDIRLPRLLAGILAGASLAGAGAAMQSLFRNPLADPSITGVSAGAALGAVLALTTGALSSGVFAEFTLQICALVCGLCVSFAIWKLGRIDGRISALSLLLTGIAVNAFCGAVVGFAMYAARDAGLKNFIFWTLGSLDGATWISLTPAFVLSAVAWAVLYAYSGGLNVLLLGAKQAFHSGADSGKIQFTAMFCAAVMTASCVSVCGIIGFVGLVVPHILRLICGPDNRALLPLSALGGAALVTAADIISRALSPMDAVPIGVITSLIGAPVFLLILKGGKGRA